MSDFRVSPRKIRVTKRYLWPSLFLCDLKKGEKPLTKWKTMGLLYSATVVCLSGNFFCLFADDVLLFVSSHCDLQNTPQWFASATTAAASEWITRMKTWWTWEWRLQSRKTGSLRNLDYVVDSPIHRFKSLYWAKKHKHLLLGKPVWAYM